MYRRAHIFVGSIIRSPASLLSILKGQCSWNTIPFFTFLFKKKILLAISHNLLASVQFVFFTMIILMDWLY